jgi:nicotinamidase-related amidase
MGIKVRFPARPQEEVFDMDETALLVIDMQRDFLEPGGFGAALGNDVSLLSSIIPCVRRLISAFRIAGLEVIHTVEGHRPDLSDCPAEKLAKGKPGLRIGDPGPMGRILILGEPGNAPVAACTPLAHEKVIEKPGKGAFYRTDLENHLRSRGVQTLVICGVTAEVCVQTTAREAADRGFRVILVSDATASYIPAFKDAVIEMVVSQGGIVGSASLSKDLLFALLSAQTWKYSVEWAPLRPGLEKASLGVAEDGWEAAFLRYQPGAQAPRHRHTGTETIVILSGSQSDDHDFYPAGSYMVNLKDSVHSVTSSEGCLLWIDWESPVEFL